MSDISINPKDKKAKDIATLAGSGAGLTGLGLLLWYMLNSTTATTEKVTKLETAFGYEKERNMAIVDKQNETVNAIVDMKVEIQKTNSKLDALIEKMKRYK